MNKIWTREDLEELTENTVRRSLKEFKISRFAGFLAESPPRHLPLVTGIFERDRYFAQLEHVVSNLPYYIEKREMKKAVSELKAPFWSVNDLEEKDTFALMRDVSMAAHAFFHEILPYKNIGELVADKSEKILPAQLAIPLWKLHKVTGIEPSMSYYLYSLWNYYFKDPLRGYDLHNLELIRSFTGSIDESWFVRIHQGMEHAAAQTYRHLLKAEALSTLIHLIMPTGNDKRFWVEAMTDSIWSAVPESVKVVNILNRMREHCDYRTYFQKVRMFYGFPQNVVFEGVEELAGKPQDILGETGGHTPLMQFWNFVLGINLDDIEYFPRMRRHMRTEHRNLVERMKGSNIRNIAAAEFQAGNRRPANAYNAFLRSIIDWREEHLRDVEDYIEKHGESHGTGKPPLDWLWKLLEKTREHIIS